MERTLVLLKPDALQRGLVGGIIARLEGRGLKLVGLKLLQLDQGRAQRLYQAHIGKPFYPGLAEFMTSRPIIAMAVEGKDAVEVVRRTMGATVSTANAVAASHCSRNNWSMGWPGTSIRPIAELVPDSARNTRPGTRKPRSASVANQNHSARASARRP